MKKILLIMLCFMLSVQPCLFAAEENIAQSSSESSDLYFAKALGLISDEFKDDTEITRSQLAEILSSILIGDTIKEGVIISHPFTDCDADNAAIAFVNSAGLMKGLGGNLFNPSGKVTYAQLIKTAVSLLGYENEAIAYGGYPSGYLIVASNIGLIKGDAGMGDAIVTARKLSSVLKLMQNVSVKRRIVFGGSEEWIQTGENYLSLYKGIKRTRGMITAIHSTDVYSDGTLNYYDINIDDERFSLTENSQEMINFLGYRVDAYSKESDNGKRYILYYEQYRNQVLEISANDMISSADGKITYVLDEYKDGVVTLSDSAFVIYNGTTCTTYNDSILNPFKNSYLDGCVKLIDHNGDRKYDVISIDAFDTFVVSRNADGKIYNKYRPQEVLDIRSLSDEEVEFTNILGQPVPIDYPDEGDIISVSRDTFGKVKRLTLTVDTYIGIVKEIEKSGDVPSKVILEDTEFTFSRSIANSPEIAKLKPGQKVKFFFNKNSQVSDVEIGEYIEYIKGFLADAAKEGAVEKECKLKIFTAKDKFLIAPLAKQVLVNEEDTLSGEEVLSLLMKDVTSSERIVRKAILYSLNDKEEINKIKISDDTMTKPNDVLYMYKKFDGVLDRPQYKDTTKSFGNQLLINDGTAIFVVPTEENRDNDEAYVSVTPSYFEVYSTTPKFKAYGTDAKSPLADILVIEGNYSVSVSASYILVVDKYVKTTDEDGEQVYKLYATRSGAQKEYFVEPEDMPEGLTTGDVLRYGTKKDGTLTNLTLIYDCSENKMTGANPSSATFTASPRFIYGKVVYNNGNVFTVEAVGEDGTVTTESFPTSGFAYTECNFRNRNEGNPQKATAENLFDSNRHPGNESEALVFTYSGGAMEVIIFNK